MSMSAEALRELHRLHHQLTDLRDRLARGPRQVKASEAAVAEAEAELQAKQEQVKRTELTIRGKELTLKERENRILDIRVRLNSCSSNKEYQAYVEQIAADDQANSVLSDEILELLDKVGQHRDLATAAKAAVADAMTLMESVKSKVASQRDGLETDLASVSSLLSSAEVGLPAEIKQEYNRVVKARGEDGMAPLEGEVCGGCFQRITPQMTNELQLGQLVFCKSCGRLLYVPENTSPSE